MVEKILVAWDGSQKSYCALEYAICEAENKGLDEIDIIHVQKEKSSRLKALLQDYKVELNEIVSEKGNLFTEPIFEKGRLLGEKHGVYLNTHILDSEIGPAETIVDFARRNNFNHIILGSHGRKKMSKILLGSIAQGIIERASCVITVVRCNDPLKQFSVHQPNYSNSLVSETS